MNKRSLPIFRCLFLFTFASLGDPLAAREWKVPGDLPRIQEAIDQAEPGDVILVAPGTYRESLVLKPRLTLRSEGDETAGKHGLKRAELTILDSGGGDSENGSPGVTMAEGAVLDGFSITGVGTYDGVTWQKHWDEQGANQAHEHIGHFGRPAVAIRGLTTCTVKNNRVHHNGGTGIAILGEADKTCAPLVEKNHCFRNMGGGIGSMGGSTGIITGNTCFENFYAGIGHDNASPLVFENVCTGNIRAGIGISEGACPVVRNNDCHRNRRAGIGIRTGKETRPLVEDNRCYANAMAGIGVEEEASPILRNNRCHHNALAGIGCREHASPLIDGNYCYKNEATGIGIESATAIIRGNRCEENHTAGIGINGKSSALVIENTCLENRTVAVGIPAGGDAVLNGNTLTRTGGMPPIVAILNGAKAVLSENTLRGGGVGAVMLDGQLTAIANTLEGQNGGSGIVIRQDGRATLSGNTITGYRKEVSDPTKVTPLEADR